MCIKCTGGMSTKKVGKAGRKKNTTRYVTYEIIGDGNTQRHTVPPLPGIGHGPRGPRRPSPGPVEHGTLRAVRGHRTRQEDLCESCERYSFSDAYLRDMRQQSLDAANRQLTEMMRSVEEGDPIDTELRESLERRRAKLERQLFGDGGEEKKKKRHRLDEPARHLSIRIPERIIDELKERAKREDTTVSELARQALDAFLVL